MDTISGLYRYTFRMGNRSIKILAISIGAFFLGLAALLATSASAGAMGDAQVIVELRQDNSSGLTVSSTFSEQEIGGTDAHTKQQYKFQRQRRGKDFSYTVANLEPSTTYRVELSFVEHDYSSSGSRKFNVYVQSSRVLSNLDIFKQVGKDHAFQRTYSAATDADGLLRVRFRSDQSGCKGEATVSTVRVYRGSVNVVEIDANQSRHNMSVPIRHSNDPGQNPQETVLGRLGARICLNLLPQRLAARFSSLGDGTGDLADLVLAVREGSSIRALPFTDRYPAWEEIDESQAMTGQRFRCSSPGMALRADVRFTAPFYPGDERVSGAPFFYIDVTVTNGGESNASGEFYLARPHSFDFATSAPAPVSTDTVEGMTCRSTYSYFDESYNPWKARTATEILAVPAGETGGVQFKGLLEADFTDFGGDSLWGLASPSGYPDTYDNYKSPLFSFYPRGYSGAKWNISDLAPGDSVTRHFVLGGYVSGNVLRVSNSDYTESSFKFRYTTQFADATEVAEYAVSDRWAGEGIQELSDFFDSTISSGGYLAMDSAYAGELKKLCAYSFQSFIMNTWWARSASGRDWFSVWEGSCCRYHSTVDVAYNHAWFYFCFWPELLETVMDEWTLYLNDSPTGTYLSHDMGYNDECTGQAYPHNMAVEENCNYILLLYKYWKTTGDSSCVEARLPLVEELLEFLVNCDGNDDGLPDKYTWNTLDQSSAGLQYSKDQTYLGVKCMAAFQAAREMARAASEPGLEALCRGRVELVNQTLEYELWLSDHFAVCLDADVTAEDREAYSIYASNGLLYLLSGTRRAGVTSGNLDRMALDMENTVERILKKYGCPHSSYDVYNEWVSQNLWRDMIAGQLGVDLNGGAPVGMVERYWDLQRYFATGMQGSFWDVLIYPGGTGGGRPGGAFGGYSGVVSGSSPLPGVVAAGGSPGAGLYGQSLGYYPRGATSLGLIESAAGVTLDRYADALYYQPCAYPLRVPLFSCADWEAEEPGKRVPVLYFADASSPVAVTNRGLLPSSVEPRRTREMFDVESSGHAISPNGDGVNDESTVSYKTPLSAAVTGTVWKGSSLARDLGSGKVLPGQQSLEWDGRDGDGRPVSDGIYTARLDAAAEDSRYEILPAGAPMYVNSTIPDLARDWYLAEGFTGNNQTGGEFQEYILMQNPGDGTAAVEVTFMLTGGETVGRSYTLAPRSRFTITVDDILPDAEVSTHIHSDELIAVERSMYFSGRRAGHDSIGVSSPSKTWYLAEGYTAEDFDEYVLIQNPGEADASVQATFMTSGSGVETREYDVGAHSRFTIHVDDIIPAESVSTRIESTEPVVVERAQYLNDMKAGTCSIGARSTASTWYLAEGYTDQGFEEWVLIQNPGKTMNNVTVTFMERSGANTLKSYQLSPESRFTINVDEILPASEVSVKVRSEDPVLVERAMYWNERSDGHAFLGTPTPDSEWYLAEGYTAQGFETWILVQNPSDATARVNFTFMEPSGNNTYRTYWVGPRSRFTVGVDEVLPASEVSTRVNSDVPVIVERAVYFNSRSGGTDSLGIRGY